MAHIIILDIHRTAFMRSDGDHSVQYISGIVSQIPKTIQS